MAPVLVAAQVVPVAAVGLAVRVPVAAVASTARVPVVVLAAAVLAAALVVLVVAALAAVVPVVVVVLVAAVVPEAVLVDRVRSAKVVVVVTAMNCSRSMRRATRLVKHRSPLVKLL